MIRMLCFLNCAMDDAPLSSANSGSSRERNKDACKSARDFSIYKSTCNNKTDAEILISVSRLLWTSSQLDAAAGATATLHAHWQKEQLSPQDETPDNLFGNTDHN